jgi:hypothetical protein
MIKRTVIILVCIFALFFTSCVSTDTEGKSKLLSAFHKTQEESPGYFPFGTSILDENLSSPSVKFIPIWWDGSPNEVNFYDNRHDFPLEGGPSLYINENTLRYFKPDKSMAASEMYSVYYYEIDLISGVISNKSSFKPLNTINDVTGWIRNNTQGFTPIDLIYLKDTVNSKGLGTYEAIASDLPLYIYEKYEKTGKDFSYKYHGKRYKKVGVRRNIILVLGDSYEDLYDALLTDALYPAGYHYVTGYDAEGYNREGFAEDGYGRHGFDRSGTNQEGDNFNGQLTKDGLQGFGTLSYANGDILRGWFRNSEIDGQGIYYGADGSWYAGSFQNGIKSGQGVLQSNGVRVLEKWNNGTRTILSENVGDIIYPSGQWAFFGTESRNGKAHGKGRGVSLLTSELIPAGRFVDGALVDGIYITEDGIRYEGNFKDGFLNEGTVRWPDGHIYSGSQKNGLPHGNGKLQKPNGSLYQGSFVAGMPEGHGIMVFTNGDSYEGGFTKGLPHGDGLYRFKNGEAERCEYLGGQRIDEVYKLRIELARANEQRRRLELAEEERRQLEAEEAELRKIAEEEQRAREQQPVVVERNEWAVSGLKLMEDINSTIANYNKTQNESNSDSSYNSDPKIADTKSSFVSSSGYKPITIPVVPSVSSTDFIIAPAPTVKKNQITSPAKQNVNSGVDEGNSSSSRAGNSAILSSANSHGQDNSASEEPQNSTREAIAITWKSSSGKWYAVGPIQAGTIIPEETEAIALGYVTNDHYHSYTPGNPNNASGDGKYYVYYLGTEEREQDWDVYKYAQNKLNFYVNH